MANMISTVFNELKTNLKNRPHLEHNVVDFLFDRASVSHESADAATSAINTLDQSIDLVIGGLVASNEDFKVSEAQIASAKMIAAVATDPARAFEKMTAPQIIANKPGQYVVSSEAMNVEGYLPSEDVKAVISQESFDGQQLNNAIYFSIAYNLGASVQDEFGETLYPTIPVSPTESGVSVSLEYVSIMREYLRDKKGTPVVDADVDNYIPVVKAMFDPSVFGVDTSALIPVFRQSENEDVFVSDAKYVDDTTTLQAITTAPLKFNKAIDILGVSQTDDMLAKGTMDNTDAVDRAVSLTKVYIELGTKGDGTAATAKEIIAYDVSGAASKRFFAPPQGHYKLLVCNFKLSGAALNTSNTKKIDGSASDILASGEANTNIMLQFQINGELNTESGVVDLTAGEIRLLGVRNANGELVDEAEEAYTKAQKIVEGAKLVGYVLDAKRTNTNVRTRGVIVTNQMFSYLYPVPFRSGVTCIKSLVDYNGKENDANRIAAQSQTTGFIISNLAVSTLVNHVESLRAAKDNGALATLKHEGIGSKFTKPYFSEESIDLADVVDSLESNKRDDDVRSNLLQRVNNIAMDMIINSWYGPAFQVFKGNTGSKITIVIATDPNIARLIVRNGESEFEYGDRFKFKVVSTYNELMKGRIIIVPTVLDANKNTTPDPLNFGFCAYTPTIVYEVSKTTNGAVAGELNTIPRFLHVTNLAIAGVINISDVANVFSKIALNTAPKARN